MTFPRRVLRVLTVLGGSVLLLVLLGVALLQIPAVATWAARSLVPLAPLAPEHRIDIGRAAGNWLTGLRLQGVVLRRGEVALAQIDSLRLSYDLTELLGSPTRLGFLGVDGARVAARRRNGGWDIAQAFRTSGDTAGGGSAAIVVERFRLRDVGLSLELGPDSVMRVHDLTLRGEHLLLGDPLLLGIGTLHARVIPPGQELAVRVAGSGALTREALRLDSLRLESSRSAVAASAVVPRNFDDPRQAGLLDVRLRALPLDLADVSAFFPVVASEGDLHLEASASAEGRLATATLAARLDQATLRLTGATLLGRDVPALYRVKGELSRVDPSDVLLAAPEGSLTGDIEIDLRGQSLDSTNGSAALRFENSELAGTELALELDAELAGGRAELDLRGSVAEAPLIAGGRVRPFDSVPSYQLSGLARRIPGAEAMAAALSGSAGDPTLSVGFRVEGEGVAPERADLSGRVSFAAVQASGQRVPLGHATVSLAGGRLQARPELLIGGGRVTGRVRASIGDTVRYTIRDGMVEGVSLAALLQDSAAGRVSGRFAVEGAGLSPEEAVASAWLRLDRLRHAGRSLDGAVARARLRKGRVLLNLAGELQGGGLAVAAAARPFDSVASFTVDSAALRQVDLGTLLGRPDLAGPVSLRASGEGRWGGSVRVVEGLVVLEPGRMGELEVTGGTVAAELRDERLSFEASLRTGAGSLALAGGGRPMDAVPSYRVERGRVDSLDLGPLLGRAGLATSIGARFSASATGTGLDSMRARLDLELLPSTVNQAALGPGDVEAALDAGRLTGTVRLEGDDAHLDARLRADISGAIRRLGAEGSFRLERLARWFADPEREGRLEGGVNLEAALDSLGLLGVGGTITAAGGVGRVRLQQLHAALEPASGALALDTLVVRSNVASFDGSGRVALRDTAAADTLRVLGRTGDLNALAELAGVDSLSVDSTRLALVLSGGAGRRRLAADVRAHGLLYASNLAEALEVNAATMFDDARFGTAAGTARVEGLAVGQITAREVQLAGRYDSVLTAEATADFSDEVALKLGLQGEARGDTTTIRLERLQLSEGGRTWALAHPAGLALRPDGFQVEDLALRAGARQVALDGLLAFRDTSDLSVRIDSLELDALADAGLVPVPGRLDGTLRLGGPAASPVLEGRLALAVHRGERRDLGRVETEVAWSRRSLRVEVLATPLEGGPLTVEGILPWGFTLAPEDTTATFAVVREPGDTLHLAVEADSFALSLFRPFIPEETARRLRGVLTIDALVRGTPEEPQAEGRLQVARLGFGVPAIEVDYDRGSLSGRLEGRVLRVDSLVLHTGDEEDLVARGEVRLEPLTDPALDLSAELRDFMVSNSSTLQAEASGQVRMTGTLEAPVVTGTLRMGRTEFYTGGGPAGLAVEEVELTPEDRRELARNFGPAVLEGEDGEDEFLDRFRLDLALELPGQVWFRRRESPELDVEVTGRIRLRQEPNQGMRFFGSVEPVPGRSRIDVYGRTFALTGGTIVLEGPVEQTSIDVMAEYQVPVQSGPDDAGVLITVEAMGRPDSIALDFSSEPEMPQEDMLSYIVTGRPSSDNTLVQGGGGEGQGGSLALGQLTEAVSGAVSEELGFDVFQIRQDGTRGLVLTAGRYFSPHVFISLQQPLETGGEADERPGTGLGPGFELQYRMRRWLRASVQGGSLPTGIRLRGRYAY